MEDCRDWGPRPFKFLNAWVLHPNFLQAAEKSWKETQVAGWAGYKLFLKFKNLKGVLKEWNVNEFGDVN